MIFNNLIYQDKIINSIKSYVKTNKIPHAFLFYGYEGSGKIGYAIEFAATLLCDNLDENLACGSCISCTKIKNIQHENINYIHPLPTKSSSNKRTPISKILNDSLIKEINLELSSIMKEPYSRFKIKKANSILINSIRDIKKDATLSNINDKRKIYIIIQSEKLCFPRQESANALLKILEEPPNNSLFILVTSNFSQILDTIKSRCTKVYFPKLDNKDIKKYLISEYKINDIESEEISNICNGNIISAKDLMINYNSSKNDLITFLDALYKEEIKGWIEILNRINDKQIINSMIKLFEVFISDIISLMNKKDVKLDCMRHLLNRYLNKYSNANWFEFNSLINFYYIQQDRNVHIPLIQLSFFIESVKLLNGQSIDNNINFNE